MAMGGTATTRITVMVSKTVKIGKDLVNNSMISSVTYNPVTTNNSVVQKTLVLK